MLSTNPSDLTETSSKVADGYYILHTKELIKYMKVFSNFQKYFLLVEMEGVAKKLNNFHYCLDYIIISLRCRTLLLVIKYVAILQ